MCKITDRSSSVKILGELNRASSILRDVFNDTFTSIQIDDEELYNQTKDYLQEIAPSKQSIVKFYQSNDTPIFEIQHRDKSRLHLENSFHE
jgi:Ribonuclease G/E